MAFYMNFPKKTLLSKKVTKIEILNHIVERVNINSGVVCLISMFDCSNPFAFEMWRLLCFFFI